MVGRGDYTLFRFRGIPIGVDWSWFLVLFLLIWWLSGFFGDLLLAPEGSFEPYALAVVSSLLFFASILLHEMGHAVIALRNNIGISHITLWMFGGIAGLERDSRTAGEEFRIAAAGPAVTLMLTLACIGIGYAVEGDAFWNAALYEADAGVPGWVAVLAFLANINAVLFLFNLIPAFPLDGGRIARAAVWRVTGDRERATSVAARVGQGFAILFVAVGFFLLLDGNIFGGIWLGFIGWMLFQAARASAVRAELNRRLGDVSVADVMDTDPVTIAGDTSVEQALDEYFFRYQWPWFPVVDPARRFLGLLKRGVADGVPEISRPSCKVSELLDAGGAESQTIRDDEPIEALLDNTELRRLGALAATDADGRLSGVITLEAVGRALREAVESRGGESPG